MVAATAATSELVHRISSILLLHDEPCVGKGCRREFLLPGMVNVETRVPRQWFRAGPQRHPAGASLA